MHTVLEGMEIGELPGDGPEWNGIGGTGAESQEDGVAGDNSGHTPPARQEDDSSVIFPGDHAIDDPTLLQMRPARSQREIDLESLDFHLQGYSVRQIAKMQNVHPQTAFDRIKRGRQIDAKDPLRAEGMSLHAQVNKLRRMERGLLPAAEAGDLRSTNTVLRIWDRMLKLGKLATDQQANAMQAQDEEPTAAGQSASGPRSEPQREWEPQRGSMLGEVGSILGRRVAAEALEADILSDEMMMPWDFMLEMLPHRAEAIGVLRAELEAEVAKDEARFARESARQASGRCEPPAEAGRWFDAESQAQAATTPGGNGGLTPPARQEVVRQGSTRQEQQPMRRPLTRKERALHKRAKREARRGHGASAARTGREQCASAGADSGADTHGDYHRENGVIAVGRAIA